MELKRHREKKKRMKKPLTGPAFPFQDITAVTICRKDWKGEEIDRWATAAVQMRNREGVRSMEVG